MLSTSPVMSSLPAPVAAAPKASGDADGESFSKALNDVAEPEAPMPGARPASPQRAKGRAAETADAKRLATTPPAGIAAPGADGTRPAIESEADTPAGEDGPTTDGPVSPGEVCSLLADLQSRHARLPPVADGARSSTATEPVDSRTGATPGARASLPPTLSSAAGDGAAIGRSALPASTPRATADAAMATSPADPSPVAAPERSTPRSEPAAFTLPAPATAAAPAAPGSAVADAPRAEATLTAPLASPEFAPQLGATLTTFVRDGIGHAQLHLNPAEMGPVSVQIQLDGQNAQVLLGADHAATRLALEQSLPLLAGSLREAGLTLAGGGVFEQGQQARDNSGEPGTRGDKAQRPDTLPPLPLAASAPQRRGVVDLVA